MLRPRNPSGLGTLQLHAIWACHFPLSIMKHVSCKDAAETRDVSHFAQALTMQIATPTIAAVQEEATFGVGSGSHPAGLNSNGRPSKGYVAQG